MLGYGIAQASRPGCVTSVQGEAAFTNTHLGDGAREFVAPKRREERFPVFDAVGRRRDSLLTETGLCQ